MQIKRPICCKGLASRRSRLTLYNPLPGRHHVSGSNLTESSYNLQKGLFQAIDSHLNPTGWCAFLYLYLRLLKVHSVIVAVVHVSSIRYVVAQCVVASVSRASDVVVDAFFVALVVASAGGGLYAPTRAQALHCWPYSRPCCPGVSPCSFFRAPVPAKTF